MKPAGFYCQFCKEQISDEENESIRFYTYLYGKHFKVGTYFRLSAKMGNYGGTPEHEGLELEKGAKVEFCCPHEGCRKSFRAPYNDDLAEIGWVDEAGKQHVVAFNRILGKQMTYVIDLEKGELIASHGRDRQELIERWAGHLADSWRIF